jgi:hypothetical protein
MYAHIFYKQTCPVVVYFEFITKDCSLVTLRLKYLVGQKCMNKRIVGEHSICIFTTLKIQGREPLTPPNPPSQKKRRMGGFDREITLAPFFPSCRGGMSSIPLSGDRGYPPVTPLEGAGSL